MAFKLGDFNSEFKLLPEGEYEVFVSEKESKTSANGNPLMVLNYTVRDDVETQEEWKGQKVSFDNFTATDNAMWRFNILAKAVGLDVNKEYETPADMLEDVYNNIQYKALRIVVKHEVRKDKEGTVKYDPQTGKPLLNCKAVAYKPTQFPNFVTPAEKDELNELTGEISKEQLPF